MTWVTAGAGLLFGLALVTLVAFFVTKDARYDRVAEWAFVGFGILATPTILSVAGRLSGPAPIVAVVTGLGLAGAVVIGVGELALTLRLVPFQRLSPILTLAFVGFLVWIGGVSLLIVSGGALPSSLGWLGVVSIAVGGGVVVWLASQPGVMTGEREPGRGAMVAFVGPMIGIVVWMLWLGASL